MQSSTNDKFFDSDKVTQEFVETGFQNAEWEIAIKKQERNSNRFSKGEEVSFFVNLEEFKQYGPGTYLFFVFTKRITILFIVISFLSVPTIICNYMGGGLKILGSGSRYNLMQFSLGNQLLSSSNLPQYQDSNALNKYLIAIPDALYSVIFFIFYLHWTYDSDRITEEMKMESHLPSYFAVQIVDIPPGITQQHIYNFMSQFGQIKQISPVRNYEESIELCRLIHFKILQLKQQNLRDQIDQDQIILKQRQLEKLYKKLNRHIKKNSSKHSNNEIIKYFLAFELMSSRKLALQVMKRYNSYFQCYQKAPENLYCENHLLHILPCNIQPGSIMWQNIHISPFSRFVRYLIQILIVTFLIFIGFLGISFLNILSPQPTTMNIDIASYNYTSVVALGNENITAAWCQSQSLSQIYNSNDYYKLCEKYLFEYYSSYGISIAISIIVLLIKQILRIIVYFISKIQRFDSYNNRTSYLITSLFITYIFTTVIITIFLQAKIFNISFKLIINSFISNTYLKSNTENLKEYNDFSRSWYIDIGYKIILSWFIMAFVPHCYDPILLYIKECISRYQAKKEKFQKNMDLKLRGEDFKFQQQYANILLIVFVSLGLSGPIPLLLILGTIALITRYIYYKFIFIRFCRLPTTFDQSLNTKILNLLPYAIFIHLAISIFAYGNSEIFPIDSDLNSNRIYSFLLNWYIQSNNNKNSILQNLVSRIFYNWYLSVLLFLFIFIFFLKSVLFDSIKYLLMMCRKEKIPTVLIKQNKEFQKNEEKDFITSYRIEYNKHYSEILAIFKSMKEMYRQYDEIVI